ncbi:MAG: phosphopyruvate hydratase [Pseudomonadota bacterium]|nr:phosphopyruvate hydratase [Pseudomonadota bacterium]
MSKILKVHGLQVFDSRGIPTVSCKITLENGLSATSMAPSGASTGSKEALELRDSEESYAGKSVFKAIENINNVLGPLIVGKDPCHQNDIDNILISCDGTADKSKMGANAILAVSLAVATVASKLKKKPLYEHFAEIYKDISGNLPKKTIPMPMFNILNGGEHADNNVDIQEFMIIPSKAKNFSQVMQWSSEIYQSLKSILISKKYSSAVGDEGGFAPSLNSNEEALQLIIEAIKKSNLSPGIDVNLALDCASSEFYNGNEYVLDGENKIFSSQEFANYLEDLVSRYPIISIEDGMDENDIEGWRILSELIGDRCQLVGDDLFVTNKKILEGGIEKGIANSILIKFNQVGTLSETIETIMCANKNNYKTIISHRSGETEDTTISDLAVGLGSGQIKTGAPCRSDRVAKYNRLLWIEEESIDILLHE